MILIYILFLLILVLISFKITKGDYFNLSFIFIAGYFLSALCCLYNFTLWNVSVGAYTIFVLISGIFFFILGSSLGNLVGNKKNDTNKFSTSIYTVISNGSGYLKLAVVIFIDICVVILLYRDIVRIANINMVSWGNLFYNFRSNLGNEALSANYNIFVNIGLRLTKPFAYIYLVIFFSNIFSPDCQKTKFQKGIYALPVLIYGVQVLLQGYRVQLIALIVAAFFCVFFFNQINNGWQGRIKFKYIWRISLAVAIICIGFYYVKFFIGKLQESNGVLEYITNYLGGPVQLFDMYLNNPVNNGHETFAAMVESLNRAFGMFEGIPTVVQHEHRSASTGVYIGNVYTAFRNYYNDFGIVGTAFFSMLLGYIFSYWYAVIKKTKNWTVNRLFGFTFYASLLYVIVFHFFTDYFFCLIGLGWLVNAIIFYLLIICMFKFKISIRTKYVSRNFV